MIAGVRCLDYHKHCALVVDVWRETGIEMRQREIKRDVDLVERNPKVREI